MDTFESHSHSDSDPLSDLNLRQAKPVYVGRVEYGNASTIFISRGFYGCSALLLHSTETGNYGLFHVTPKQELGLYGPRDGIKLKKLQGAKGLLIEGSRSDPNPKFITTLAEKFNIHISPVLRVQTQQDLQKRFVPWHLVYRPKENTALIVRPSFKDVLRLSVNV